MNTVARFETLRSYHVYNRTNNQELLFRSAENRRYFLSRLFFYLKDFVKFYAFSLLPNHFHLLISVKSVDEIGESLIVQNSSKLTKIQFRFLAQNDKEEMVHELIVNQFLKFFTSYTKSYNNVYNRNGNLFARSFKRSLVYDDKRLVDLHYYIIHNARNHNIVKNFKDHKWNSFSGIIDESPHLDFDEVINLFGSKTKYVEFLEDEENGKIILM